MAGPFRVDVVIYDDGDPHVPIVSAREIATVDSYDEASTVVTSIEHCLEGLEGWDLDDETSE